MDEQDDSSLEAEGSRNQNRVMHRKVADTDFSYPCEWNGCSNVSSSMNEFNHHLSLHRRAYTRCLGTDQEIGSAEFAFYCHWKECNACIEGQIDDFCRHVFYHTFHQYLKFLGQIIIENMQLEACLLGTASRNVIPELPEKLMCRWHDCGMEYDNPYIFYSHVTHHCNDYPRGNDPKVVIRCRWEGCQAVTKSTHKLKDHVKSHTQAKVVACPTCGSLFASNTRFIDHYKRQSPEEDLKFECSHCNHRFASERILRDHMRHHINHYKCPLCDMTCTTPSAVRDHVRYRHSEERGFQCSQCQFKAKTANDLRKHLCTHQQKDVIRCAKGPCDKTFSDKSQLFEHYHNDHEITRDFECHLCAKRFSRGQYLTVHLKEYHSYRWPSGHSRFRYKQQEDGIRRLQTIRYESIEVSQEVLGQKISPHSTSAAVAGTSSDTARELFVNTEIESAVGDDESSDIDAEDEDEDLVVMDKRDLENCNKSTVGSTSKAAAGSSKLTRDHSKKSTVRSASKAAEGSSRLTQDHSYVSTIGSASEAAAGSSQLTQNHTNNKKLNAAKRKRQDPVSKPETSRKTDLDQTASIRPDDCPSEGVLPGKQRGKKRKKKEKEEVDSGLKQDNFERVSRQI